MLRFLSVQNFALIDRLEVEFGPGLNLITGETGSGKSIVVDAVGLLLGSRASQDMIREGSKRARLEGLFQLSQDHPALALLADAGIELESDRQLVVRREISVSGNNKVFVNGVLATQGFLAELGNLVADIHGQHEQQHLLHPRTHLRFLDAFGRLGPDLHEVSRNHRLWSEARRLLEETVSGEQERLRSLDMLRFQIREIDALELRPGLDRDLVEERSLLASAEKRLQSASQSYDLLYEREDSLLSGLSRVSRSFEELAELDPSRGDAIRRLEEAVLQLQELAFEMRDYADDVESDPQRLEDLESRLAEIQKAQRKYGEDVEAILEYRRKIGLEMEELEAAESRAEELGAQVKELAAEYLQGARRLSSKRKDVAGLLARRMEQELADLAMQKTSFEVDLKTSEEDFSEQGIDRAEFLISPNPGESLKPLGRIASGGELSRVILALKSIVTLEDYPKTLIFDEVDAGIGGRVASVLGEKLSILAQQNQVLCVTHLPQIAARAVHHYHVGKRRRGKRTRVEFHPLDASQRIEELARMLAGKNVTETTLQQAREMIRSAD